MPYIVNSISGSASLYIVITLRRRNVYFLYLILLRSEFNSLVYLISVNENALDSLFW